MSFAGHVFDMIRRNKEDREMLRQLRDRGKDTRAKYASQLPDISAEEFDRINRQVKEREQDEQKYFSQIKYVILLAALAAFVLLWIILKVFSFWYHHNFTWREEISPNRYAIVHRKRAAPAGKGQPGLIPGSMATPGLERIMPAQESLVDIHGRFIPRIVRMNKE